MFNENDKTFSANNSGMNKGMDSPLNTPGPEQSVQHFAPQQKEASAEQMQPQGYAQDTAYSQQPQGYAQDTAYSQQPQGYAQEMAYSRQPQGYTQETAYSQPQNYAQETAYSQPQNYAQETAAPSRDAGDKKKKKKSIPFGFAISLVLICAVFSLAAGFGGGIWAAEQIGERVSADINKNIGEYLEENGATVLYRSVATEQSAESGEGSSYTKDSVVTSVANLAADSVVEISTQVLTENIYSFFGMGGRSLTQGAGSGVILSNDGYILTCYHVIEDAESIGVTLRDGSQYEATMVGGDKELDIAVIKVEATDLVPAVLGSSDALEVGSPVVAIGNPLGQLGGTVTGGYISALDRALTIDNTTYNLLQTDAAINGGNSGGGLFNANGELVGLVSAKAASVGVEGLGFAIPIDDIAQDIEDLINYGYITSRVTLGVTMVDIMDQRTALAYRVEDYGVYILNVTSGSNAELAGLQAGDRIVSIDGTAIESGDQVVEFISTYSVGDVMDMVISRDGQEIQVLVTMYGPILDTTPSTPVNSGI